MQDIYYDVNSEARIDSAGGNSFTDLKLKYQSAPTWRIHFKKLDKAAGTVEALDVSSAVTWSASVDDDFDHSSEPMCRTLDADIDASQAADGIIDVPLDANTETFKTAIGSYDKKREVYFELRGFDSGAEEIFSALIKIVAVNTVDPLGGDPPAPVGNYYTKTELDALIRAGYELQFSVDGSTLWHTPQVDADRHWRYRYPDGEWSPAIAMVVGPQGDKGDTGDPAPNMQIQFSIDGATLWHETFASGDIYIRTSVDGGSTWTAGMKFVGDKGDTGDPGANGTDGTDAPEVQIQYSSDNATWGTDYESGDIYIRFSTDGGSTWTAGRQFTSSGVNTDVEFDDADLTAGMLTVTGTRTIVSIVDNNSDVIIPDSITYGAENTTVDLTSYGTISGTWKVLFAQGKDGEDGINGTNGTSIVWANTWSDAVTYDLQDVVYYDGSSYISIKDDPANLNKTPGVDTDYWELVALKGTDGSGDVTGPASSTDGNVVTFNGATGKIIKDSGLTLSGSNTGDEDTSSIKTKLGAAATGADGYLTSTDWNTFNGKQASFTILSTLGNLSSSAGYLYNDGAGTLSYASPSSTDSNAIHKTTAAEINGLTEKTTPADNDEIVIEDSADSYAKKKVKISNLPAGSVTGATITTETGDLTSDDANKIVTAQQTTGDTYTKTQMHFDGDIVDATGLTTATDGGTSSSTSTKKFGTASRYFGGSAYIQNTIPVTIGTGDFTIEMWVYIPAFSGFQDFFATQNRTSGGFSVGTGTSNQITFYDGAETIRVDSVFTASTWHHVCIMRSSGTVYAFVDGVLKDSAAWTRNFTDTAYRLGSLYSGSEYLTGYIDEFRISTTARYSTSGFTPDTSAFADSVFVYDKSSIKTSDIPQSNLFINGTFAVWQRSTDDTAVTTTRKYVADRFAITTGAGTLAHVLRSTTVPSGSRSKYSLELTGATGVTTVTVDQRIEAANVPKSTVYFSAYVYNGSGAAFTPKLYVSTPAASDTWTTPTVINGSGSGESLQSCADSAWTRVYWTADISGYSNIVNGVEFKLEIPSGSLVSGDTVRVTDAALTYGSAYIYPLVKTQGQILYDCMRYYWIQTAVQAFGGYGYYAASTGQGMGIIVTLPVPMRIAPTVTKTGTWIVSNCAQPTATYPTTTSVSLQATASGAGRCAFYNAAGTGLIFDAEL